MANRFAMFVGLDQTRKGIWPTCPYAEAGITRLAAALAQRGVGQDHRFLMLGAEATRAVVLARLRQLRQRIRQSDRVLLVIAGRGATLGDRPHALAWDTVPDLLEETSLPLHEMAVELARSRAQEVTLLLDVGGGLEAAGRRWNWDPEPWHPLIADEPRLSVLCTCAAGQQPLASPAVGSSLSLHLAAEAVAGRLESPNTDLERLTVGELCKRLHDASPRWLRRHFAADVQQQAILFGPPGNTIAELPATVPSTPVLDRKTLQRVLLRSASPRRLKQLAGFHKSFSLPVSGGPVARKFVARCAEADLRAEIDGLYAKARGELAYKRKDLETRSDEPGTRTLCTPDFEYTVRVDWDPSRPAVVLWQRELSRLADPAFLGSPHFLRLFAGQFDELVFEWETPWDVAGFVDQLEESPPAGLQILPGSDGDCCLLQVEGFRGSVKLAARGLTVRGQSGDSSGLFDLFLAFVQRFRSEGAPLVLPSRPGAK